VGGGNTPPGIFNALIAIEEDEIIYEKGKVQQLLTLHAMTVGRDSAGKRRHDSSHRSVCAIIHSNNGASSRIWIEVRPSSS
jgi:hypothetical protein